LDQANLTTREQIKQVAQRLLVLHGYPSMRLADVADELSVTRANVHYHFGSKQALVAEIIDDYMTSLLRRYELIWTSVETSYADKVRQTIEFNRWRFVQFHEGSLVGSRPWSLLDRMRSDVAHLTDSSRAVLSRLARVDGYVTTAVKMAQATGEIGRKAPAESIAVQLSVIISCAGTITQYWGGFEPLERIYLGHLSLVRDAYPGTGQANVGPLDFCAQSNTR
jgi:TetR/AcrR family transcriptional regulator, transcriptional repressor for nem operon